MGSRTQRVTVAGLLAAGVMAVAVTVLPAGAQSGTTTRKVKITMKCTLQNANPVSLCRGSWRMTGESRDKGTFKSSSSNDSSGSGAYLRATMDGGKGDIYLTDNGVHFSHRRRGCSFVATYYLRGDTRGWEGFRGQTGPTACVKLKVRRRTTTRSSSFAVTLTKRG